MQTLCTSVGAARAHAQLSRVPLVACAVILHQPRGRERLVQPIDRLIPVSVHELARAAQLVPQLSMRAHHHCLAKVEEDATPCNGCNGGNGRRRHSLCRARVRDIRSQLVARSQMRQVFCIAETSPSRDLCYLLRK